MATKKKGQIDSSKFEGNGISFKAKLIGTEEVAEARGDLLCQETITRLKNSVKASGQHKQKIFINVTLEGLKVIDAVSLATNQTKKKSDTRNSKTSVDSEEAIKTDDMVVLHTHPVHRISFISRDTTDNRAFGYIIGSGDGKHTYFAIKTAAAAEQLVLTLRDLFQVVYEMTKNKVNEAKEKLDTAKEETAAPENEKPSGEGSTSEEAQTQKTNPPAVAEADGIYQVPPNNAPVNGSIEQQQANLLDLEDQADSILKGIEQIKNLEFDSITNDEKPPSSPMSPPPAFKPGTADPWAVPASTAAAPATANSNLNDLAGIKTGAFSNMPQQPFPGASFPGQMAGYNVSAVPGYPMAPGGLPVTRDPFGNDPFSSGFQQPGVRPGFPAAGFGPGVNPFGAGGFGQQPFQPGLARAPMPGGMFPGATQNPFASSQPKPQEDPNLLKPIRNDQQGGEAVQAQESTQKAPKADLFEDLLGITKSTTAAKNPKDMFAQLSASEKKSINELKAATDMPPKASFNDLDPFLNEADFNVLEDKRRGLIPSEGEDPFDTSHIPFLSSNQSTNPIPSSSPPPLPQRLSPTQNPNTKEITLNKSSPSSASSLSPSSSSSKLPSLLPPPPPSRVKINNTSPTLPSRLALSSNETVGVSNNPDQQSFILPSPDEPPPPLPQTFIKSPAAPPPPPRPSSSRSVSSLGSNGQQTLSPPLSTTNISPSLSVSTSKPQSSTNTSSTNHSDKTTTVLRYDLTFNSEVDNDPFSIPLKSSSFNETNNNNFTDPFMCSFESKFDSSPKLDNKNQHPSSTSNARNSKSVISNKLPKDDRSQDEIDPFGLPQHLTPGFKAVARFGNDPFEDSFGANTNSLEPDLNKWDPFTETPSTFENSSSSNLESSDPWNMNAFADAFAPTQAANNKN